MLKFLRAQIALGVALLAAGLVQADPNAVSLRWAQNLGSSTQKIQASVEAYSGPSPGQKAAAQKVKWLQKLQAAADKWAQRTGAVTTPEWQQAMITKAIPRIGQGATAAIPKMQSFFAQFLPYVNQAAQTVRQMPSVTLEDGIARCVAQIRANAAFSYRKGAA